MSHIATKPVAAIILSVMLALPATAFAQSSSGSSHGGSVGGGSASRGSSGVSSRATSPAAGRIGPATTTRGATSTTIDPRSVINQPATVTAVPGGPPGGSTASQTQSPPGTPITSAPAGAGSTPRGPTGIGGNSANSGAIPSDNSGAIPGQPNGRDPTQPSPNELTAGGTPLRGAVGKTMAECEAAWDAKTHMSKATWRATCQRTLTEPHL